MKTREEYRELAMEVLKYLETELKSLQAKLDATNPTDHVKQSRIRTEIRLVRNKIRRAKFQVNFFES